MRFIQFDLERLEDYISLWEKELGKQFPMRKRLFIQNSFQDENILKDGSFVAVNEKEEIVGFIVSKLFQEKLDVAMPRNTGWIQVLLVDSMYRNKGIGTKLLELAESALKGKGAEQIFLGRDPWHYFPGVPVEYTDVQAWVEGRGYTSEGIEHDLLCEYKGSDTLELPNIVNVEFRILKMEEKFDFLTFLRNEFPGRWEYEAIKYFERNGTGREFVIAVKEGKIIGFCRINDHSSPFIAQNVYWSPLFENELGGVGPLGIGKSERKNGYGLSIVQAAIYFLRKRDISRICIDWTGLVQFYGKLGYQSWKQYIKYSKKVPVTARN